jgi:uncharacterized protein (TIGR02145 family)
MANGLPRPLTRRQNLTTTRYRNADVLATFRKPPAINNISPSFIDTTTVRRIRLSFIVNLVSSNYFPDREYLISKIKTMQKTFTRLAQFMALAFGFVLIFESCKKTVEPVSKEEATSNEGQIAGKKKPQNPPPPPPPFYFSNCSSPLYAATLIVGTPTNITISKSYINSTGGSYAAFSKTVNGVTFSAPAGTFNTGNGTIVFTVTGTPVVTGYWAVTLNVGNIIPCAINFTVSNAPANPATCGGDPGPAEGATGCVTFNYRGQTVTYTTVRAGDGRIWLQQNLGSPQVAFHHLDVSSFGDYFQWGRWDDGHQDPNSTVITGGPLLLNPSTISSGNPNFIQGTTTSTKWWNTGGLATDTWSGSIATSTNGKDPCAALGAGWRMPTAAEWQNLGMHEDLEGAMAAFMTNLKLPATGYRLSWGGMVFRNGDNGNYWSSTAANNNTAKVLAYDDNTYSATVAPSERGQGYSCRCIKD